MGSADKMEALLTVDFQKRGSETGIELHHDRLTNPVYRETIQRGAWTTAAYIWATVATNMRADGGRRALGLSDV